MRVLIIFLVLVVSYFWLWPYLPSLNLQIDQSISHFLPVVPAQQVISPVTSPVPPLSVLQPATYKCLIADRVVYSTVPCSSNSAPIANHLTVTSPFQPLNEVVSIPAPQVVQPPVLLPVPAEPPRRTDCNPEQSIVDQLHVDLRVCYFMQCEYLRQQLRAANEVLASCQFSLH